MMYETQQKPQTALLIGVDTGEYDIDRSLEELEELARSAGAEVVGKATQKRPSFDPATCIGRGRLAQIGEFVSNGGIDMVIFDHELSPAQLHIYSTTIPTSHRFTALMLDIPYRLSVATQNVGYNQPPHLGYYLGGGMKK